MLSEDLRVVLKQQCIDARLINKKDQLIPPPPSANVEKAATPGDLCSAGESEPAPKARRKRGSPPPPPPTLTAELPPPPPASFWESLSFEMLKRLAKKNVLPKEGLVVLAARRAEHSPTSTASSLMSTVSDPNGQSSVSGVLPDDAEETAAVTPGGNSVSSTESRRASTSSTSANDKWKSQSAFEDLKAITISDSNVARKTLSKWVLGVYRGNFRTPKSNVRFYKDAASWCAGRKPLDAFHVVRSKKQPNDMYNWKISYGVDYPIVYKGKHQTRSATMPPTKWIPGKDFANCNTYIGL